MMGWLIVWLEVFVDDYGVAEGLVFLRYLSAHQLICHASQNGDANT